MSNPLYPFGTHPDEQWISGKQLRLARHALGFSYPEASFKTGSSKGTLMRLESGTSRPSHNLIQQIIESYILLGVTFVRDGDQEGITYDASEADA